MIIDYASRPPLPEFTNTSPHLANYRRVYEASEAMVDKEIGPEAFSAYLANYESYAVDKILIKGRDLETTFGFRIANEDVAELCRKFPNRFIGFAGVDPNKGMTAVRELEFAVRELGLCGLNLQCFEHRLAINDKRMFPLYAKCVELGIPVNIHCGINFSTHCSMNYGRPSDLDEVLTCFPELRACASPPGWPWVHELLGVAWRHPNLWIGVVSVRPTLLKTPDSGYEPILRYGKTLLQDRIIFGTGFPMMAIERSMSEIHELSLEDKILEKWLGKNASQFLQLEL